MKFLTLFSGSKGNMALAFTLDTKILIDCGVSYCAAKKSLADIGVDIDDVDAVLVTHEHMDHVAGLPKFLEHNKKAVVFVHEKGARALDVRVAPDMQRVIGFGAPFVFKGVSVDFYVCSHDSAFCCGFKITENATGKSIATVTDTGFVNGGFDAFVGGCEAVVLESNYDETMLRSGRYPAALKRRIMSECGHLSNAQACELIVRLAPTSVKTVVLAHLSEENNSAELAFAGAVQALAARDFREGRELKIIVAKQYTKSEVLDTDD